MDQDDFRHFVWDYTRRINDSCNQILNVFGNRYCLTVMQLRILLEIYHNKASTIGNLATSINVAGTNVSTMCKKLEQRQLIIRCRSTTDERVVLLSLDDPGLEIISKIDASLSAAVRQILSPKDYTGMKDIMVGLEKLDMMLEMLNDHLDENFKNKTDEK